MLFYPTNTSSAVLRCWSPQPSQALTPPFLTYSVTCLKTGLTQPGHPEPLVPTPTPASPTFPSFQALPLFYLSSQTLFAIKMERSFLSSYPIPCFFFLPPLLHLFHSPQVLLRDFNKQFTFHPLINHCEDHVLTTRHYRRVKRNKIQSQHWVGRPGSVLLQEEARCLNCSSQFCTTVP